MRVWAPLARLPGRPAIRRPASRRSAVRRSGGWSLLELVISLAISVLALTIAGQLLYLAQLRSLKATRDAVDPSVEVMFRRLRVDLYGASSASPGYPPDDMDGWHYGPLVLGGGNQRLEYERAGNRLLRRNLDDESERPVLYNVRGWRWRATSNVRDLGASPSGLRPLVVIEIDYGRYRFTTATVAPVLDFRRDSIAVALRGGGGPRW